MSFKKKLRVLTTLSTLSVIAVASCSQNATAFISKEQAFTKLTSSEIDKYTLKISTISPFDQTTEFGNPLFGQRFIKGDYGLSFGFTSLFRFKSTGDWKFDDDNNIIEQPTTNLELEQVKSFELFKLENDQYVSEYKFDKNNNPQNENFLENYQNHATEGRKITFKLNNQIPWVEAKTGKEVGKVSAIDYLTSIKIFYLAKVLNITLNDYYYDLLNLDKDKTFNDPENNKANGDTLNIYFNEKYSSPFLFDFLRYFLPLPTAHEEIQSLLKVGDKYQWDLKNPNVINVTEPLVIENGQVNVEKSDYNKVYGWGDRQKRDAYGWYSGPYFLYNSSIQDATWIINSKYFDHSDFFGEFEKKIPRLHFNYNTAYNDAKNAFQGYRTGDLSYIGLDETLVNLSVQNLGIDNLAAKNKEIYQVGGRESENGGWLYYNTDIYQIENGEIILKSNISKNYETFIKNWHTPEALTIRKGINGLINFAKLAEIVFGIGKYNLTLSQTPYDTLRIPVLKENSNTETEIIPYNQAIYQSRIPHFKGIENDAALSQPITGALGYPFHHYLNDIQNNSKNLLLESLPNFAQEKQNFIDALTKLGYSKQNPLDLNLRLGYVFNNDIDQYFKQLVLALKELSDGILDTTYKFRDATIAPDQASKNLQLSTFGWGADFRDAATFLTLPFVYGRAPETYPDDKGLQEFSQKMNLNNNPVNGKYQTNWFIPLLLDSLMVYIKQNQTIPWAKSLWEHFKTTKGIFKNPAEPNSQEVINFDDLSNSFNNWLSSDDGYKRFSLLNWTDNQYLFILLPRSNYYTRTFLLVNQNFIPQFPQYGDVNFASWEIKKQEKKDTIYD